MEELALHVLGGAPEVRLALEVLAGDEHQVERALALVEMTRSESEESGAGDIPEGRRIRLRAFP